MFKIKIKIPERRYWLVFILTLTYFTPFSSVSIAGFERVYVTLDVFCIWHLWLCNKIFNASNSIYYYIFSSVADMNLWVNLKTFCTRKYYNTLLKALRIPFKSSTILKYLLKALKILKKLFLGLVVTT